MTRLSLILCVVLLPCFAVSVAAMPFENPPEENTSPDQWKTSFPYQRNAMLDFATNPSTWPSDPNGPTGSYDLLPTVNYDLEGWDDPDLYESDWLLIEGDYEWMPSVPGLPGTRTGILMFDNSQGTAPLLATLTWHLDNWPDPRLQKDIWSELIWLQTGTESVLGVTVTAPQGHEIVDTWFLYPAAGQLQDGWLINDGYGQIVPNPEWEQLTLTVLVAPEESFFIDSWHTATECVPEPGTMALFGLGITGIILWRRRKVN